MVDFAGLDWFVDGGTYTTYVRLDAVLCRIGYDEDQMIIALYPEIEPIFDYTLVKRLLEMNLFLSQYGSSVGLADNKIVIVRQVHELDADLRSLIHAAVAALKSIEPEPEVLELATAG